jgi:hypothetical protein
VFVCMLLLATACRFGGVYSMMFHDHAIGMDPCRTYNLNNMLVTCYKPLHAPTCRFDGVPSFLDDLHHTMMLRSTPAL